METVSKQDPVVIANFLVTPTVVRKGEAEIYGGGGVAARVVAAASANLGEIFAQVNRYVEAAAEHLRPAPGGPAETSIEFGIKVSADGSLVFAGMGAEVHMKVNVKWTRE